MVWPESNRSDEDDDEVMDDNEDDDVEGEDEPAAQRHHGAANPQQHRFLAESALTAFSSSREQQQQQQQQHDGGGGYNHQVSAYHHGYQPEAHIYQQHHYQQQQQPDPSDEDDEEEEEEEEDVVVPIRPRGKPQALAAALAAKQVEAKRQELLEEQEERREEEERRRRLELQQQQQRMRGGDDEDEMEGVVVEAVAAVEAEPAAYDDDDDDSVVVEASAAAAAAPKAVPASSSPKKKKKAAPKPKASVLETASTPASAPKPKKKKKAASGSTGSATKAKATGKKAGASPAKKRATPTKAATGGGASRKKKSGGLPMARTNRASPGSSSSRDAGSGSPHPLDNPHRTECFLSERPPTLGEQEYANLRELFVQFCKVPLLAEFSRPVALLHPELAALYKKIVSHPVDLGHVCRGIRRKEYKHARDVRLDMWRVFSNCILFHSHPHNKEAVPSFVSIALHLREYFNILWQEYMLPSDISPGASELTQRAFQKRAEDRKKRMENSGILVMSKPYTTKMASLMNEFLERGGCVDGLDRHAVIGPHATAVQDRDLPTVFDNLKRLQAKLVLLAEQAAPDEYSLDDFHADLRNCYTADVLEENVALRNQIGNRIDRFFWKRAIILHEANSRGVTQSSIWGNVAATIWARESSKKAYWPALCLGILPPEDQREGWHAAVTERNESRLPEKLRTQLLLAKRKCEQAQKRQNLSYFLVEFLGTHEFIWVRETDIIEKFDRSEDPNKAAPSRGKKRASRSHVSQLVGSKTYATALEECEWACEEYEAILQGAFEEDDTDMEGEDDDGDLNYNFSVLSQSDDEADDIDDRGYHYDEDLMSENEVDQADLLVAHDGVVDPGMKVPKKKTPKKKASSSSQATKTSKATKSKVTKTNKKKAEKEKKEKAKKESAAESARKAKKVELEKKRTKAREEKKELKDLEKRRRKRTRDREKALRDEAKREAKRKRAEDADESRGLSKDKRARATAIVKAYLVRTGKNEKDYKGLALNGVMAMPAAMVDPTGLLGMALAFRAAAGEINMPDESQAQITKSTKPWAAIDTRGPKTSEGRCQNLERQIELMELEIQRIRANTVKRRELTRKAVQERDAVDRGIEADDAAARLNHFRKKRKFSPKTSPNKETKPAGRGGDEDDGDGEDDDDTAAPTPPTTEAAALDAGSSEATGNPAVEAEEPVVAADVVDVDCDADGEDDDNAAADEDDDANDVPMKDIKVTAHSG